MVRDGISRAEAYALPRERYTKPTRLGWRGAFTRQSGREQARATTPTRAEPPARDAPRAFVAPPWRLADWSFAILAAIAGLLTALAVFVLIGSRGLPREPLPLAPSIVRGSALAAPPAPRAEPQLAPPPTPPPTPAAAPLPAAAAPAPEANPAPGEEQASERAVPEHRKARRERRRGKRD